MKKLKKNFITETDELKAYIRCSCPACACGCQDISSSHSVQTATNRGYNSGKYTWSAAWN